MSRLVVKPVTVAGVSMARDQALAAKAKTDMRLLTSLAFYADMADDLNEAAPTATNVPMSQRLRGLVAPGEFRDFLELYSERRRQETGAWGCLLGMLLVMRDDQEDDLVLEYAV